MKGVVDKKYCKGCYFFSGGFEGVRLCNYYLMTGKRRPCPAGVGCTVKLVMKKRKANISVSKNGLKKLKKGGS